MYFIALVAPEDINRQVVKWKNQMKEKYGCEAALRSPAHITLVPPFWMKSDLEIKLLNSLTEFSPTQSSFLIQLNGFSHFKPKVIFAEVVMNDQLMSLRNNLYQYLLNAGEYPLDDDNRPFHPHVTIATRDLHKKAFQEAWEYFKERKYSAEWLTKGISLLRHNKKNWDVVATSQFK